MNLIIKKNKGELTDLRQALVNNKFFAQLAVKYNMQRYLKYESMAMFNEITKYSSGKVFLLVYMILL